MPGWPSRRILPTDLRHDGNIFTGLRWLLASTVMFSHGWDLTQARPGLDPSVEILTFPVSRLAVFLFFTLSGFLVSGSLIKRGVRDFALARALRMLPGLWVMLLVTMIGLALAFGTLPLGEYLHDRATWRYLVANATLLGGSYGLPGIFTDHRFAVVNGSLWTIPQEVRCYIVLALVGATGLLLSRAWLTAGFAVAVLAHLVVPMEIVPILDNPRRLALSFFLGVLAYVWRDRLRLSWPAAIVGAAVALGVAHLLPGRTIGVAAIQVGFAYLMLVAAFCVPAAWKRISAAAPDYSYGIYIYAFPAQQAVIALGWGTDPLSNIACAFALMLPFAAASWHLIEKPALGQKRRFTGQS